MTIRHLFASLLVVSGGSLLPSGSGSSPAEPSTTATDPNAPRPYRRPAAEKACTIDGNLDARCMEVAGHPSDKVVVAIADELTG